jgi:SAM-dependent methyltransferase
MTNGYVTDVPYVRTFTRELAPAWLDHVALISGVEPPRRNDGFRWCDLGCGHGFTAAVLAATHPSGEFVGIDVNPAHTESARQLAVHAGVSNARFLAADFNAAARSGLPAFDYIVSHGVYSWVSEPVRASWRRFIQQHLKPGGLVYVSYNALPGRAADLPLQRLVRALGSTLAGDSEERASSALGMVRSMLGLKVPTLVASPMATVLTGSEERGPAYLAHELMGADWEPLSVMTVRADLASIGLLPVGSAMLIENHDAFVLGRAARAQLQAITDPDVREFARDYFISQSFRRDVFTFGGRRLSDAERHDGLMDRAWWLSRQPGPMEYWVQTPAGKLNFDNPAARHIVNTLAAGPRRLREISNNLVAGDDLIANALVLSAAGVIWPVEGGDASVDLINRAIKPSFTVMPFGTAVGGAAPPRNQLLTRRLLSPTITCELVRGDREAPIGRKELSVSRKKLRQN